PAGNLTPGQSAQFTATATLSNSTTQVVTACSWSSSNTAVATISGSGNATAVASGETDIRCLYQGVTGAARLRVDAVAVTPTGLTATGSPTDLFPNQTVQLTATARMSDGSSQDVTGQATWSSSNAAAASVSSTALVTAVAVGDTDIRAAWQGLTALLRIRVIARPPSSYSLSGIVRENTSNNPLPGATVQVTAGDQAGRSTTTGSDGRYQLSGLTGTLTVQVSAGGYANQTFTVTLTADASRDLTLTTSLPPPSGTTCPVSGSISAPCGTATAFCNDGWYSCSQNRSGTCSTHGGVRCWICPGVLCNPIAAPTEALWTPVLYLCRTP
ncbi:MAG: carboxypeptidase regulatory-like domain-containing protein, partial [Planctomycetes bacterium]|nr:carboxypeptidase regulatory-like domain-containing protein [Planctomycetota bacterium]